MAGVAPEIISIGQSVVWTQPAGPRRLRGIVIDLAGFGPPNTVRGNDFRVIIEVHEVWGTWAPDPRPDAGDLVLRYTSELDVEHNGQKFSPSHHHSD